MKLVRVIFDVTGDWSLFSNYSIYRWQIGVTCSGDLESSLSTIFGHLLPLYTALNRYGSVWSNILALLDFGDFEKILSQSGL